VRLDEQRFAQVHQSNLVYQCGVVLAPGAYHLKFVARENESSKIGTFERDIAVPQRQPGRISLSSVLLSTQLVPVEKSLEVETKGQGPRAKLPSSPLEMAGEKIVPSVTRFFTQQQTLYVLFQAYYPENSQAFDPGACFAKFRGARPTIWVPRNTGLEALAGNTASALFSLFPRCFQCVHKARPHASRIERISLITIARALEHPWNKPRSLWGDFQQLPGVEAIESTGFLERAMGIEPTSNVPQVIGYTHLTSPI